MLRNHTLPHSFCRITALLEVYNGKAGPVVHAWPYFRPDLIDI